MITRELVFSWILAPIPSAHAEDGTVCAIRVSSRPSGSRKISTETLISGFQSGSTVRGRPVDLEVLDDQSILLSDDKSDTIYRIRKK